VFFRQRRLPTLVVHQNIAQITVRDQLVCRHAAGGLVSHQIVALAMIVAAASAAARRPRPRSPRRPCPKYAAAIQARGCDTAGGPSRVEHIIAVKSRPVRPIQRGTQKIVPRCQMQRDIAAIIDKARSSCVACSIVASTLSATAPIPRHRRDKIPRRRA